MGLCPLHDERTPSFTVSPSNQLFKCFGCDAGGDVLSLVQLKEGLDFPAALEFLARRAGIKLQRADEDPGVTARRARRARARTARSRGRVLRRTSAAPPIAGGRTGTFPACLGRCWHACACGARSFIGQLPQVRVRPLGSGGDDESLVLHGWGHERFHDPKLLVCGISSSRGR